MQPLILTPEELEAITGRSAKRPRLQLPILHTMGFHRPVIHPAGRLVLERAHYEAVSRGEQAQQAERQRPAITPPARLRAA